MAKATVLLRKVERVENDAVDTFEHTFEVSGFESHAVFTVYENTNTGTPNFDNALLKLKELAGEIADSSQSLEVDTRAPFIALP